MKIAITSRTELLDGQEKSYVNTSYLHVLQKFALDSCILPLFLNDYHSVAEDFAGLLLTGGADIDPAYYGQENRFCLGINKAEDENDLQLIQSFRQANKPILGICRGLQAINVAFGGSLLQDIANEWPTAVDHNSKEIGHPITVSTDSFLYKIFGESVHVNSYHHQAIAELAPGFKISAVAEDGIIEAIEKDKIIAVQWHPERMSTDQKQLALFQYFINLLEE